MKTMRRALWSLVFLLLAGWLIWPNQVLAASSDDFTGNYVRRDAEDYNYLPLILDPGASTGNTGTLRDRISYNMVYDQGYEVQCARPAWEISAQVYGAIDEYFKNYNTPITLSSSASYNVDFTQGTIPLFRGDEDLADTKKNTSFEGYFGANYQGDTPPELNSAGVANVLMTTDGQCAAKYANLKSLFDEGEICSKLADPDQCVLDREITGTSFTTESLYRELTSYFTLNNGERNLNCTDITGGWQPELAEFGLSFQEFQNGVKPAADAVKVMPLNLDVLYRLAFLVISPQQNPTGDGGIFSFLQNSAPQPAVSGGTVDSDRHAPIVIAFKVPFTATNTILSLPSLRDSALLSAYSINDIETLQREQKEQLTNRGAFIDKIITNKESKPIVNCDGMAQCTGGSDSQQLFQALIDVINGSTNESGSPLTCGEFKGPYENAGDLGSPATASAEKAFREPYATAELPVTNSAGFSWSLVVADENAQTTAKQEGVPVTAHLITPYGSNLTYIAEALQTFFDATEFQTMVENNCIEDFNGECGLIPEYFTFGGITADLDSGSDSYSFVVDPQACEEIEDPALREQCQTKSFGATLTEQPREPLRILGAQLGWMIRKAQEVIRGYGSKAQQYIQECKRTEDLFLGRCLGYQGQPGGSDSEVANSCNDYAGIQVDLPGSLTELGNIVCSVAHNNPQDVQLLWGMTQTEGAPMNRAIKEGKDSIACADLIINSCGASQIIGLIIPQCIEPGGPCSVDFALDEGEAGQAYRDSITNDVACSVRGQLEYILNLRKSQIGELKAAYRAAHGTDPSTQQLYYMLAGKNPGLSNDILVNPGCAGAPPVSGCDGLNYCQCVMDKFTYQCGQSV
jgi:hypothetical protein